MNPDHLHLKRIGTIFYFAFLVQICTILFPITAAAQSGRYDGWHPMMRGWGMGGFGMILNIAFWVLAAVALVWLIRWIFQLGVGSGVGSSSGSRALDILNGRYARGEIDKLLYDAMKQDIFSH